MINWCRWFREFFVVPEVETFLHCNPEARCSTTEPRIEVRALIDNIDRFLVKNHGPRCEIAKPGCKTCQLWRLRDLFEMMVS
jgi:hypothetical protein